MRKLLPLLLWALYGATDLRLRSGGYNSTYRITAISATTPAVVSVVNHASGAATHSLVNGDTVHIQLAPCWQNANGYRKVVNANQGAGTFGITDMSDVNITCSAALEVQTASLTDGTAGLTRPCWKQRAERRRITGDAFRDAA